jgi:hypothetical protein
MKAIFSFVLLACAAIAIPAVAAKKDDAFVIDKKEFKKQFKTIALSPIDADPVLKMPDSVAAMVEEEITKHLEKRGYVVIPSSVLGGIRNKMEALVGGVTNP